MIQLELPLNHSTRHCGKAKDHVSHAYELDGWWGCPGVPDIREVA